jgi:hypothetical protein
MTKAEVKNTVGVPTCAPDEAARELQATKDGISVALVVVCLIVMVLALLAPDN